MQVNERQGTEAFNPVTITITLETPQELRGFGTLCNYSPIVDAGRAVGIDISECFNELPMGAYDSDTWDQDVAPMAKVLANHPAIERMPTDTIPQESSVPVTENDVEDFLNDMVEDFLTPIEESRDEILTVEITDVIGYGGTINVSDGRTYTYLIANCGVAIQVKDSTGEIITEIPATKRGSATLHADDIAVIATVLSKIS